MQLFQKQIKNDKIMSNFNFYLASNTWSYDVV